MLLSADEVLTGTEMLRPGWIEVAGGTITALGAGDPPRPADRDLGAATVTPGFVDTHVHGGGGGSFSHAGQIRTAVALHRRHGTTTMVVVPCRRCRATAVRICPACEKLPPPPPCTWVSTKPGVTVAAPRSRSAGRGGSPAPSAVIVPPATSIQPGRNISVPVSTSSALSST